MRSQVVHHTSSSILGPVDPSIRALSGRIKLTVRLATFNKDWFSLGAGNHEPAASDVLHQVGPGAGRDVDPTP